jgi:hypothetical protein
MCARPLCFEFTLCLCVWGVWLAASPLRPTSSRHGVPSPTLPHRGMCVGARGCLASLVPELFGAACVVLRAFSPVVVCLPHSRVRNGSGRALLPTVQSGCCKGFERRERGQSACMVGEVVCLLPLAHRRHQAHTHARTHTHTHTHTPHTQPQIAPLPTTVDCSRWSRSWLAWSNRVMPIVDAGR